MADGIPDAEVERYVQSIVRMRQMRDEAVIEVERLGVELERLRDMVDATIREASERWKRLVPPALVGPGDGTG